MEIRHPRRILIVGPCNSGAHEVVKDLTGSAPPLNDNCSTAGLTHVWNVRTAYYTADVPIWMDEITDAGEWKTEFLKPEAKEVVAAVGAWIYCFRKSQDGNTDNDNAEVLKAIQEVLEEHVGYSADTVMLAVAIPTSKVTVSSEDTDHTQWEDLCIGYGFEYIDYAGTGMNEFREKTGFDRLKEALEANEWTANATEEDALDLEDLDIEDDNDLNSFARDEAEMTAELFGMKAALNVNDYELDQAGFAPNMREQDQVEDLDRLMGKLLAVKEQSADLPEAQRKKMAAKAVRELMQDGGAG